MKSHLLGGSWMFLLLLLVVVTTSYAQRTPATCGLREEQLCSFYFRRLEDAFTGDENIVYELQKVFFPVGMLPPGRVDVIAEITLDNVPNIRCKDDMFDARNRDIFSLNDTSALCSVYGCIRSEPYQFEHRWIRSLLSFVIEREELGFLESVNFVAYAASFFNHIDFSQDSIEFPDGNVSSVDASNGEVQFSVRIPNLPCIPEESVMLDAWEDILPWIQLYARNRGGIEEFVEDDRGYPVQIGRTAEIDNSNDLGAGLLLPVLTTVHVLLMVVIALLAMRLIITFSKDTLKKSEIKPSSPAISLYWSNVFVSGIAASVIIAGNISLYGVGVGISLIQQSSPRAFAFRITSDITTGVLLTLELVVATYATKNKAKLKWVVQTVALWVQMVLLQLAAASILPVVIVCLRNPTPSIAFATLMAATYFCLVVFIAHFIQIMKCGEKAPSSSVLYTFLLQAFAFLVFLGIVACIVIVYLRFVQAGSSTGSVVGIVLSLIPSVGISAVSGFAKKQLLSEEEGEGEGEGDEMSKGKADSQTGLAKYTATFRNTILGSNGKTATAKQGPLPVPNGKVQAADDAAVFPEYVESHNSSEDTEKVSLDLEPSGVAMEPLNNSTEIGVTTMDTQPSEAISNRSVVDTNV